MPLMELVLRSRYKEQELINRFNYLAAGTPASVSMSFALVSAFGFIPNAGVYPATAPFTYIRNITTTTTTYEEAEARDVFSVTDFYTRPFVVAAAGLVTGEGLSPFVAAGLRTNRVRSDIRRGTKRFGGISEASIGDGGTIIGGFATSMANLATSLSAILTYDDEGNTLTFSPCVVGKQKYTTPEGNEAYRYYPTEVQQLEHVADGVLWEAYDTVRSQTSRQYGRGR